MRWRKKGKKEGQRERDSYREVETERGNDRHSPQPRKQGFSAVFL